MKRRLILMRHAKSSWSSGAASDHERPLNERGRQTAPRVAERLVELNWSPELVVSSDSTRTRQTFAAMQTAPGFDAEAIFLDAFYHAGIEAIRDALANVADETATVLALGHNPGWEEALALLSRESIEMKTADAALLEGAGTSWGDALASAKRWKLVELIRARSL